MNQLHTRRPLKSRGSQWAARVARLLLRAKLRPNQISVLSIVFAAAAAVFLTAFDGWWSWLPAALCIQLRLLCNLMDGMLAVEGGLKTANGELYNEFPDRLADVLILAALGHASGNMTGVVLGWLCACGALMTACVRMHGASINGHHDFRGPMAKPHRMALATAACLLMAGMDFFKQSTREPLLWILGAMLVGIGITIYRRLMEVSRSLKASTGV